MFAIALLLFLGSSWLLFHQIGAQWIGSAKWGDRWKVLSFVAIGCLAAMSAYFLTIISVSYEDGAPAPYFSWYKVLAIFAAIGVFATLEGYGFLRFAGRIFHGKDAAK